MVKIETLVTFLTLFSEKYVYRIETPLKTAPKGKSMQSYSQQNRLHLATLLAMIFALCTNASALETALNENIVLEWWDTGNSTADEAEEILELLQNDNQEEACVLAEIYALETCPQNEATTQATKTTKRKNGKTEKPRATKKQNNRPSLKPSGYVKWKGQSDSLGHLARSRTELRLNFYRYTLQLGSQELLSYKNNQSEAHFGQISTKQIHSHVPLDTLWGTTFQYPIKNWLIAGTLDTSLNKRLGTSYSLNKSTHIGANIWHSRHHNSASLDIQSSWGYATTWLQSGEKMPLVKVELHGSEKTAIAKYNWKSTLYFHGDSVPEQAYLTPTLLRHKFWGSQTFSASYSDRWQSKVSGNARLMIPLDTNTAKGRLKATAESGPKIIRATGSVTCIEANKNCIDQTYKLKITSSLNPTTLFSSIQATHAEHSFKSSHFEFGAAYTQQSNSAKITFAFPELDPQKRMQIRSDISLSASPVKLNLSATLQQTREQKMHPVHGFLEAKILF